jgi:hypothetical protein
MEENSCRLAACSSSLASTIAILDRQIIYIRSPKTGGAGDGGRSDEMISRGNGQRRTAGVVKEKRKHMTLGARARVVDLSLPSKSRRRSCPSRRSSLLSGCYRVEIQYGRPRAPHRTPVKVDDSSAWWRTAWQQAAAEMARQRIFRADSARRALGGRRRSTEEEGRKRLALN